MSNPQSVIFRTQQLVRFPSYSGQEKTILNYIADELNKKDTRSFFQGNNLIVFLKGKDPSKAFIFNGHVDVVSLGDKNHWHHNPWQGEIIDNRIFGRGTSNMKAGIACMMELADKFSKDKQLPCDVWFTFVTQEETSSAGTKSFCHWFEKEGYSKKYKEMGAVFPEPTGFTKIGNGSRGNFFLKVTLTGEAGHSAAPKAIKHNAMAELVEILETIKQTNREWEEEFCGSCFTAPTITPTAIEGKSGSPNKIAERVEVVCDLRTIPEFHQEAYKQIEKRLVRSGVNITLMYPEAPPSFTPPDSKIVRALKKTVPNAQLNTCAYATDMGFTDELGIKGVIFGPGQENQAHTIDESAPVDQILAAPEIYAKLYYVWAES